MRRMNRRLLLRSHQRERIVFLANLSKRTEDEAEGALRFADRVAGAMDRWGPPQTMNEARELCALCILTKPEVVVESGVAAGYSSRLILEALSRNAFGRLYSVELVPYIEVGEKRMDAGYLVPEGLRERWSLLIGDSRTVLPKLLKGLGSIDLFVHDSEHTYEHMTFEFRTAWPYLREGGFIISDDISWNGAFSHFAAEVDRTPQALSFSRWGFVYDLGGLSK